MRGALRILLHGATLLSALLCAVVIALWVRSYRVVDLVTWDTVARGGFLVRQTTLYAHRGAAVYACTRHDIIAAAGAEQRVRNLTVEHRPFNPDFVPTYRNYWEDEGLIRVRRFRALGFEVVPDALFRHDKKETIRESFVLVPLSALALALAILPVRYGVAAHLRRSRERKGRCRHCGYDLRATPDRCPECGTAPSAH